MGASVTSDTSDVLQAHLTANDPDEAAKLVNLYVSTFIETRRQQRVDELLSVGSEIQSKIADLADRVAEVRQPLTDLERRLAADPGDAELQEQRDDLAGQLAPALTPLEGQRSFYESQIEDLELTADIAQSGGAQVLTLAEAPEAPVSPKPMRDATLALVLGLMLSVGLAFLIDTLDERIRSVADLELLSGGLPTLAVIPEVDSGDRVAVVCCDLRRPKVQDRFGVNLTPGLTDVLVSDATVADALRRRCPPPLRCEHPHPPRRLTAAEPERAAREQQGSGRHQGTGRGVRCGDRGHPARASRHRCAGGQPLRRRHPRRGRQPLHCPQGCPPHPASARSDQRTGAGRRLQRRPRGRRLRIWVRIHLRVRSPISSPAKAHRERRRCSTSLSGPADRVGRRYLDEVQAMSTSSRIDRASSEAGSSRTAERRLVRTSSTLRSAIAGTPPASSAMKQRLGEWATWVWLGTYFFVTLPLGPGRVIGAGSRAVEAALLAALTLVAFALGARRSAAIKTTCAVACIAIPSALVMLLRPRLEYGTDGQYAAAALLAIATYGLTIVYAGMFFDRATFIRTFRRFAQVALVIALLAFVASRTLGTQVLVSSRLDTGVGRLQGTLSEPSAWAPVLAALLLLAMKERRLRAAVLPAIGVALAKSPTVYLVVAVSVAVYLLSIAPWRSTKPFVIVVAAGATIVSLWFVQTADPNAWLRSENDASRTVGRLLSGIENVRTRGEDGRNDRYASTDLTFAEIDLLDIGLTGAGPDAHTVYFEEKYPPTGPIGRGPSPNALWVGVAFNYGRPAMLAVIWLVGFAVLRMRRDAWLAAILVPFALAAMVNSASGFALYKFAVLTVFLALTGRRRIVAHPNAGRSGRHELVADQRSGSWHRRRAMP